MSNKERLKWIRRLLIPPAISLLIIISYLIWFLGANLVSGEIQYGFGWGVGLLYVFFPGFLYVLASGFLAKKIPTIAGMMMLVIGAVGLKGLYVVFVETHDIKEFIFYTLLLFSFGAAFLSLKKGLSDIWNRRLKKLKKSVKFRKYEIIILILVCIFIGGFLVYLWHIQW